MSPANTGPNLSDSLVTNIDAALEQQILDVPQRGREPHVHHDDQPNDLRKTGLAALLGICGSYGSHISKPDHCLVHLTTPSGGLVVQDNFEAGTFARCRSRRWATRPCSLPMRPASSRQRAAGFTPFAWASRCSTRRASKPLAKSGAASGPASRAARGESISQI